MTRRGSAAVRDLAKLDWPDVWDVYIDRLERLDTTQAYGYQTRQIERGLRNAALRLYELDPRLATAIGIRGPRSNG